MPTNQLSLKTWKSWETYIEEKAAFSSVALYYSNLYSYPDKNWTLNQNIS